MKKILALVCLLLSPAVVAMEKPEENTRPNETQNALNGFNQACVESENYCCLLPEILRDQVRDCIKTWGNDPKVKTWLVSNLRENFKITSDDVDQVMFSDDWHYASIRYVDGNHRDFDMINKHETQDFQNSGSEYRAESYLNTWKFIDNKQTFYRIKELNLKQHLQEGFIILPSVLRDFENPRYHEEIVLFKMISNEERAQKDVAKILAKFTHEYVQKQLVDIDPILKDRSIKDLDLIKHIYHQHDENKPIELTEEQKDTYKNLPICFQNAMQQFVHIPKETTFEKVVNTISNSNAINKLNDLKNWWKR